MKIEVVLEELAVAQEYLLGLKKARLNEIKSMFLPTLGKVSKEVVVENLLSLSGFRYATIAATEEKVFYGFVGNYWKTCTINRFGELARENPMFKSVEGLKKYLKFEQEQY